MTWRAWLRVLAFTVALLLVWSAAYTLVEYQIARVVSAERLARAELQLVERMIEAGRSIEEIKAAVESLNRRYDAKDHEGR